MKKLLCCALISAVLSAVVSAQSEKRFPGVSVAQSRQLRIAKRSIPIPLPTWLPQGFQIEKIAMKLGGRIPIEDRLFEVVYSRTLRNGKIQRFALEAGFEGLGDLPYDATSTVRSGLGRIEIAYQPPDLDGSGKKITDFAMTHWFTVGNTAFHYDGMYGAEEGDRRTAMISLADTRKILSSLQRF